jgi:hypothetical protein
MLPGTMVVEGISTDDVIAGETSRSDVLFSSRVQAHLTAGMFTLESV